MASAGGCEDLVERSDQPLARRHAVRWSVLEAVRYPDVHDRRIVQLAAHVFADLAAGDAMVDPEPADFLVGVTQGEILRAFGVRKTCWIEIQTKSVFLRPVNPTLKMTRFDFVSLD